jgi:hypothetical protein
MNCGRRFGKTVLACEEMLGCALYKPDAHISYFAPTRDDARDIMWSMLIKRCESIITYKNDSRLELKVRNTFKGESMIVLYGWESVQERGKGRGLSNDLIVCDEVSSMRNFWIGWDEVLSPTLIDRMGSALFISTPKGFNHFYDLTNKEIKDKDYKSFHFTSYDNPFIPRSEIDREKLSKPEDTFAQEYLADFRKMEGLVYKDFDRIKHVYTEAQFNPIERLVGIDWGYTNPSAIYLVLKDADANYWITQEYYKTGKTTSEIIEYAKSLRGNKYYPDPAEPDRLEEMRRSGLNVRDVSKEIEAGISSIQELLKTGRLHVHSSCVNLINEFETYRYPEKKPDMNEKEVPVKEHDHALDAIRYVLYMQQPIESNGKAKQFIPQGMSARRGYGMPKN